MKPREDFAGAPRNARVRRQGADRRPRSQGQHFRPIDWKIRQRPDYLIVKFFGDLDEHADFEPLLPHLQGVVVFNLYDLWHINSCGLREWVLFMRNMPPVRDLIFTHCSPQIITHMNMVYNFRGRGRVRTFYAPYCCDPCQTEVEILLDVDRDFVDKQIRVPGFSCEQCGNPLVFDENPQHYFTFVLDNDAAPYLVVRPA